MDDKNWKSLNRFKSFDFVENWYGKAHGCRVKSCKIKQINACFSQGFEYFSNARNASLSVKPLLLYYGVLSTSRGIILANNRQKSEEQLKSSHGLEVYKWQQTLSAGIKNVLNLEVKATNGTFKELVEVCTNLNSIAFFLNSTNRMGQNGHYLGEPKFLNDSSVITLGDLLSRSIYTCQDFSNITGQENQSFYSRISSTSEGMYFAFPFLGVPKFMLEKVDHSTVVFGSSLNVAPGFKQSPEAKDSVVFKSNGDNSHYEKFPAFHYKGGDFSTVISDFPNGDKLTEFIKICLLSYILGMLVRYYPSKWISLLKNEKGDMAQPLLLDAVSAIEKHFAEEAIKQLTGYIKQKDSK